MPNDLVESEPSERSQDTRGLSSRLPKWLQRPSGSVSEIHSLKKLLRKTALNTVCEEARCPNIAECFGRGTATFMILGDICTRGCRFCSVTTGKPKFNDFEREAESVAEAADTLGLSYVVVTSVARDDLEDGGVEGFRKTIRALRERIPGVRVEVLVPDFRGSWDCVRKLVDAEPDVLNHNLETVPRLYRRVRPGANYQRSLELLSVGKERNPKLLTKTGIMLGLGEERSEVVELMRDSRQHDIDIFTAGQYMQPSRRHLPVSRYLEPEEFDAYRDSAESLGFSHVAIGPLVRSSYRADEVRQSK